MADFPPMNPEIPRWGETSEAVVHRASVESAVESYLRQVNFDGYRPDANRVLAVRNDDRRATLQPATVPRKDEIAFFLESEVFRRPGDSRLTEDAATQSRRLVAEVWEDLVAWTAYDFVHKSSDGFLKPFDPPAVVPPDFPRRPEAGPPSTLFRPKPVPRNIGSPRPDAGLRSDLEAFVSTLVLQDYRNHLPEDPQPVIFDPPLVGVADASDPVFLRLQDPEVVGPVHRLPSEWLPGARSVVSLFFPFSEAIAQSYQRDSRWASLEFSSAKWNGSKFLNVARRALVRWLGDRGGVAVAPNLDPRYGAVAMRPFWSERHVAFIAGLGTFGLHQGLITDRGVLGRIASVVTTLDLEVTPRWYTEVYQACPWVSDGRCGACLGRCPASAIAPTGKVPGQCVKNGNGEHWRDWGYGACGHCSTFVPCSRQSPARPRSAGA